jgi:hypothetical protein
LLISGIYTIFDTYFLKKELIELVIEKVNLNKNINETGLVEIGSNLSDIKYKEYLQGAEKNIDILHIYGRTWTNNNVDFIKDAVINRKCNLRVIIMNPESVFISALENHFNYPSGEIQKYIKEMTKIWKICNDNVIEKQKYFTDKAYKKSHPKQFKTKNYGSLKMYYYNGQPTNSIYRIDDKIIVVEGKTSSEKSTNTTYMVYKEINNCNSLYQMYLFELERIIKESTSVDFNTL